MTLIIQHSSIEDARRLSLSIALRPLPSERTHPLTMATIMETPSDPLPVLEVRGVGDWPLIDQNTLILNGWTEFLPGDPGQRLMLSLLSQETL